MKKNYFLVGCLVFVVLAVVVFFIGMNLPFNKMKYSTPVKTNAWLQINPSGPVMDYNEVEYGFWGNQTSVQEICSDIRSAAFDKNVKGILLSPEFTQLSMSGMDEIAAALKEFRQAGKPILAHLEMGSQRDYLFAALADTVAMEPAASSGLFFDGVQANFSFYKNLLDKLGLKVHIIRSGQFKSYGESYSNTAMSSEAYGNIKEVLSDRYKLLLRTVSERRKLPPEQVKAVFEERSDYVVSAQYAKQMGLIDLTLGRDDFLKQNKITKKQLLDIQDYNAPEKAITGKDKIAICYLQGGINMSTQYQDGITAAKVQKMLDAISDDKNIKAVVLRVNSPGGSALESELIYRKLETLKGKIPFVVSMGSTAASGGYYISSPADYIVADPFTITGSIGVIQLLPDASALSKKIGVTNQTIAFGKYADALNFWNTPSPELLASLQRNSESVYTEFKQRVAKYRKIDYDSLDALAGGRVWSAEDALTNHLIDQVGNMDTAIMKAAELAKIKSYQTVILPERKNYWQVIAEQINKHNFAKAALSMETLRDILEQQLSSIFKPYTSLCLLPFALED